MSDLIVTKPFLRGSKRYRRGEAAPTDLDKVTQDEYLRLGLLGKNSLTAATLAPSTTKPAGPSQTLAPSSGRKREAAKPKDVKGLRQTPTAPASAPAAAVADASVSTGQTDSSVHTSAQDSGGSSSAVVDAATDAEASGATTNQADALVYTSAQDAAESPAADPLAESGLVQPEA